MGYIIRKIRKSEYPVLDDFLYEAIFIPEGIKPPPKEIIQQPELKLYTENFGEQTGDFCFVAEVENRLLVLYGLAL